MATRRNEEYHLKQVIKAVRNFGFGQCHRCPVTLTEEAVCESHYRACKGQLPEGCVKCPVCQTWFLDNDALDVHGQRVHDWRLPNANNTTSDESDLVRKEGLSLEDKVGLARKKTRVIKSFYDGKFFIVVLEFEDGHVEERLLTSVKSLSGAKIKSSHYDGTKHLFRLADGTKYWEHPDGRLELCAEKDDACIGSQSSGTEQSGRLRSWTRLGSSRQTYSKKTVETRNDTSASIVHASASPRTQLSSPTSNSTTPKAQSLRPSTWQVGTRKDDRTPLPSPVRRKRRRKGDKGSEDTSEEMDFVDGRESPTEMIVSVVPLASEEGNEDVLVNRGQIKVLRKDMETWEKPQGEEGKQGVLNLNSSKLNCDAEEESDLDSQKEFFYEVTQQPGPQKQMKSHKIRAARHVDDEWLPTPEEMCRGRLGGRKKKLKSLQPAGDKKPNENERVEQPKKSSKTQQTETCKEEEKQEQKDSKQLTRRISFPLMAEARISYTLEETDLSSKLKSSASSSRCIRIPNQVEDTLITTKKKKKKRMEHEQVVTDDRPEVVDVTPDVSLGDSDEEGTEGGGMELIVPDGSKSHMVVDDTMVHDEANDGHRDEVEEEQECTDEDRSAKQARNEESEDMQVETPESIEPIADRSPGEIEPSSLPRKKRRRAVKHKKKAKPKLPIDEEEVFAQYQELSSISCGACEAEFSGNFQLRDFAHHVCDVHNGLARPKGFSQEFTSAERTRALRISVEQLGRVHCPSSACLKELHSPPAWLYHAKTCPHALKALQEEQALGYSIIVDTGDRKPRASHLDVENLIDRKRTSATRAKEIMHKWQVTAEAPESDRNAEDQSDESNCMAVSISPSLLSSWKRQLASSGSIGCSKVGCSVEVFTVAEMQMHFLTCPCPSTDQYECLVCKQVMETEQDMKAHVRLKHPAWECGTVVRGKRNLFAQTSSDVSPAWLQGISLATQYRLENHEFRKILFPEWVPGTGDAWSIPLKEETLSFHLPSCLHSIPFGTNVECSSDVEFHSLHRFGATIDQGKVPTFFAGGPVTSGEWLPMPMYDLERQYLLVTTCSDMDELLPSLGAISRHSLIQVWDTNIQSILSTSDSPQVEPIFTYGLAVIGGPIWDLKCLPSGGYSQNLNRLGIVGCSCADGWIRIYSLPMPEAFDLIPGGIYEAAPVIGLCLCSSEVRNIPQCLSLAWSPSTPHDRLAGGMSSGILAVWDLGLNSSLLSTTTEDKSMAALLPIFTIQLHLDPVTSVSFCPTTGGRHLATVSLDRTLQVLDLNDPDLPVLSLRRPATLHDVSWLGQWPVLQFAEVAYGTTSFGAFYMNLGYPDAADRSWAVGSHGTFTVSHGDWLNASVVATTPDIILVLHRQMHHMLEDDKSMRKHRYTLTSVDVTCEQAELHYMAPTYEEAAKRFRLLFRDSPIEQESFFKKSWSHPGSENPLPSGTYPINLINKVAVNNNAGAFTWIFLGLQSGLCRLIRLQGLESSHLKDVFRQSLAQS